MFRAAVAWSIGAVGCKLVLIRPRSAFFDAGHQLQSSLICWCHQTMAKRNDLKKRLKAADRRRNRRQATQGSATQGSATQGSASQSSAIKTTPSQPSVSPSDMIVERLMSYVCEDKSPSDIVATVALKACSRGDLPSKEPARTLAIKIQQVASQPGVSARAYRVALKDLIEAAALHEGNQKETPDAFLAYLSILAGSV